MGEFPHPYGREDAVLFIGNAERSLAEGKEYHFAIRDSRTDELVGAAGIWGIDLEKKVCEIGCWLGKEYRGKGYSKEALALLSHFAFNRLGISKEYAKVFDFNSKSASMLDSVGFSMDEKFGEMKMHYHGPAQERRYEIIKSQFDDKYGELLNGVEVIA